MTTHRPLSVTIAAVLLALVSVLNLALPLFPEEWIPAFVVYSGVALGVIGLVAAARLWRLRRWSIWLTIIVSLLNVLAAPGVAAAPNGALHGAATVTVIVIALIVVLVVLPASRRARVTTAAAERVS